MPLYNTISNWNGLEIKVYPAESWRQKFRFWPYFVGQKVRLELVVKMTTDNEKNDMQFHIVAKMPDADKPRMIAPTVQTDSSNNRERKVSVENGSRIFGKGEIKYWVSNRGYNVDNEPIFSADAISMDSLIIPIILVIIGPVLGILCGLVLGFALWH